jgi:hypothetical protein
VLRRHHWVAPALERVVNSNFATAASDLVVATHGIDEPANGRGARLGADVYKHDEFGLHHLSEPFEGP